MISVGLIPIGTTSLLAAAPHNGRLNPWSINDAGIVAGASFIDSVWRELWLFDGQRTATFPPIHNLPSLAPPSRIINNRNVLFAAASDKILFTLDVAHMRYDQIPVPVGSDFSHFLPQWITDNEVYFEGYQGKAPNKQTAIFKSSAQRTEEIVVPNYTDLNSVRVSQNGKFKLLRARLADHPYGSPGSFKQLIVSGASVEAARDGYIPVSINNKGDVALSSTSGKPLDVIIRLNGTEFHLHAPELLGLEPESFNAISINDEGDVLGAYSRNFREEGGKLWLWRQGAFHDLSQLFPLSSLPCKILIVTNMNANREFAIASDPTVDKPSLAFKVKVQV